jgi:hypothetical protein
VRLLRSRRPEEHPDVPPTGYKVAFAMLSWDDARIGFRGVSLGGRTVYGVVDEARCGYGRRHQSPARGCDCGFYALHTADEAQALTCATDCREAVVLRVDVLGSYTRYERGFRYARQRVRAVKAGACVRCARPAEGFTLDGTGLTGWRALRASCLPCAAGLRVLTLPEFARLAGPRVTVASDAADRTVVTADLLPRLAAEAAFLQARLDHFQARLAGLRDD